MLDDGRRLAVDPSPTGCGGRSGDRPADVPDATDVEPTAPRAGRHRSATLLRRPLRRQGRQRQRRRLGPRRRGYAWLVEHLTVDALRTLLPEVGDLPVERFELPNLRALNFVLVGYLGEGVAASTAFDPQAKGLGEYLRSRRVTYGVPAAGRCLVTGR